MTNPSDELRIGFAYDSPVDDDSAAGSILCEYEDIRTIDWMFDRLSYLGKTTRIPWGEDVVARLADAGPDVRWIGNEKGFAGETNWSTINNQDITIGAADVSYLNTGDPQGSEWVVGECNVSIRPGWFYHENENQLVKTPQELIDIYYRSVGRNGVLLINIPPDQRGLFHERDIQVLKEFKKKE